MPISLPVEGEFTIYRATELKSTMLAAIAADREVELDLSPVSEIDTSGVQLLLMCKRAAKALGGDIRLVGHSAAVLEVFELLDLTAHFGDPVVLNA